MPVISSIEKRRSISTKNKTPKPLRTVELFAGVGGFRIGLEGYPKKKNSRYDVVWSNQWEPATAVQHASDIYVTRFGDAGHSNKDIAKVDVRTEIPVHDVLVGGFPCQDYSVARTLNQAAGIVGKKGVLWWQIHRILSEISVKPKYLILENVDRLLKSPAHQRGRDFAIMLASLSDLGYICEWRVINAGDYGFPQRRRRVFFVAYHKDTVMYKKLKRIIHPVDWVMQTGVIARAFPVDRSNYEYSSFKLSGDLSELSVLFGKVPSAHSFLNAGIVVDREIITFDTTSKPPRKKKVLKDILLDENEVPEEYFVNDKDLEKWRYLKGAKDIPRKKKDTGFEYFYSEGPMAFPDNPEKPSRTIVTGEGGSTPSRFKHVIRTNSGKYRRLTPVELEKLNGFPANFTKGVTDTRRAFFMGNALVVGVVERLGKELYNHINNETTV